METYFSDSIPEVQIYKYREGNCNYFENPNSSDGISAESGLTIKQFSNRGTFINGRIMVTPGSRVVFLSETENKSVHASSTNSGTGLVDESINEDRLIEGIH